MPRSLFASPAFSNTLPIGYTGITWSSTPRLKTRSSQSRNWSFYGFETFGDNLVQWETKGGLAPVLSRNNIPLISGYCTLNLTDATKRQETIDKAVNWAKLIKKNGGRIFVLGPNPVPRDSYNFAEHKANVS